MPRDGEAIDGLSSVGTKLHHPQPRQGHTLSSLTASTENFYSSKLSFKLPKGPETCLVTPFRLPVNCGSQLS